jgi:ATP-dependent helicase/nuclease subunit B
MRDEFVSNIYTIPASIPFADALVAGVLAQTEGRPEELVKTRILLPTRRACRTVQESFLRANDGKPSLLPQLQTIGDVDEDELSFGLAGLGEIEHLVNLPPAIPPMKRRFLLAKLAMASPLFTGGPEQALGLAVALGKLMDQIYTEGLSIADMAGLAEGLGTEASEYWQITLKFLEILSEVWPTILEKHGVMDAADRRNRLIDALCLYWQENPPQTPVIAAGSTASMPAVAKLLRVVAGLPQGCVIFPGLDQMMDAESWDVMNESHPQYTLKRALHDMGAARDNVELWPYSAAGFDDSAVKAREFLSSEMMRPAETADKWMALPRRVQGEKLSVVEETLQNVRRFDCATAQDEAALISVLMRETLETDGKVVALVTPDRVLARRVAMACRRWGLEVDDSGGVVLSDTPAGAFVRLTTEVLLQDFRPSLLATLLKHELCTLGEEYGDILHKVERFEMELLRGPAVTGIDSLRKRFEEYLGQSGKESDPAISTVLDALTMNYSSILTLCKIHVMGEADAGRAEGSVGVRKDDAQNDQAGHDDDRHSFSTWLDAHIELMEALAATKSKDGAWRLWTGDDGEAAALFLAELREYAHDLPLVTLADYAAILQQLMCTITIRSRWGTHPRVLILGQLEARLMQADLVIMGGLNEGTWPPDPGADPWMSRPMRKKFGLPSPELGVCLSAHDFVQHFCAPHVVMTRAERVDGSPTVPARWLQRLDTVLSALTLPTEILSDPKYLYFVGQMDGASEDGQAGFEARPVSRPAPTPPVSARPRQLAVTAVETWMRDPYALYARRILGLKKLKPLEEQADVAIRGTMLHRILERFVAVCPDSLPDDAADKMLQIGREEFERHIGEDARLWAFWWPRFERLSSWFLLQEDKWRGQGARPLKTEVSGGVTLTEQDFKVTAKADRIDRLADGSYALIDYKTGTVPSAGHVLSGASPQMPLEAAILTAGGFDVPPPPAGDYLVGYLGYWNMTGGAEAGKEIEIKPKSRGIDFGDHNGLAQAALDGLRAMVEMFDRAETPYYSLPNPDIAPPAAWQDYAHLARVQEWAALDDQEDAA